MTLDFPVAAEVSQEHQALVVGQAGPQLGADLTQIEEHAMPQRGVPLDELGRRAELGVELPRSPGIGSRQHRGRRRRRGMDAGQQAMARDRQDARLGVSPPNGGGDIQGREARADQHDLAAPRQRLQARIVPRIILHIGFDLVAPMEQQGPRPRRSGRQHHRIGLQAFARGQADRPAAFVPFCRHGPGADHAGGAQARRAGLQIAQPLLKVIAKGPPRGEVLAAPSARPLSVEVRHSTKP